MKYKDARAYRETIEQRGMVLGLEPMKRLLNKLGNPQDELTFVHVAGTNGKGSLIAYLEEILVRSGYRTGAYTSPAVYHPLEIFRVDKEYMTEETYGRLMGCLRSVLKELETEGIYPTVYEVETAMAFLYFKQEQCDMVLLETGLGGAMDATNCIRSSECVVFTPVGYDHMGILGNTLGEIASQKAGIIKKGSVVVSAPQSCEVLDVFRQACKMQDASLYVTDETAISIRKRADVRAGYELDYKAYQQIRPGLCGRFQIENAAIALEVVEKLKQKGYNIPVACVEEGFAATQWKGRLTVALEQPLVVLDGAHNVPAAKKLAQCLLEDFAGTKWIFLMGVLADKDYKAMLDIMAPLAERIVTITPPGQRALSEEKLAKELEKRGYDVCCGGSMQNAVALARNFCHSGHDTGILVFGSFTFHSSFMEQFQKCMFRLERLTEHPQFCSWMERLETLEQNRIYCRHGWEHCMAVARTLVLLNEERGLGYPKELLYALALLHDIGRVEQYENGTAHDEAGSRMAEKVLPDCGFKEAEIQEIIAAIGGHRSGQKSRLSKLLMEADKRTRLCFACGARSTCKWQKEKQNAMVHM